MTPPERASFWQAQLANWRSSELSAPAFCQSHSINYHQFSYWRKKLTPRQPLAPDSLAGFAEVSLPAPQTTTPGLMLTLPNGIVISGLQPGNIELITPLLRQL
ncbi:TPA: IS66 family insertion sequence element accessory protein TnpB [Aeromonas sobria]|nr:IS66 family insertion sequence element accessory protein TnpB [Aeromonas sobria]